MNKLTPSRPRGDKMLLLRRKERSPGPSEALPSSSFTIDKERDKGEQRSEEERLEELVFGRQPFPYGEEKPVGP